MSKKFQIYYADEYNKIRTEVIQKILEEECKSFEIINDAKKVYLSTKGTARTAIFHLDKYIGYNYRDLVKYLNKQGLMLC